MQNKPRSFGEESEEQRAEEAENKEAGEKRSTKSLLSEGQDAAQIGAETTTANETSLGKELNEERLKNS